VVLISGTGRNLQAIGEAVQAGALPATISGVISNRPGVPGLQRAENFGLPRAVIDHRAYPARPAFDAALAGAIDDFGADMIALAGFMRILGDAFIARYLGRALNIHPSLLPKYPGLHTHERALAAGDACHGASVHFVTPELDGGPVVLQGRTAIEPGEDSDALAARVMRDVETRIYPRALAWLAAGRLEMRQSRAWLDGKPLDAPVQMPSPNAE
jgi:phosphoribosylglycinamide formyltransferase-1